MASDQHEAMIDVARTVADRMQRELDTMIAPEALAMRATIMTLLVTRWLRTYEKDRRMPVLMKMVQLVIEHEKNTNRTA